jgi:hypothetical protein
MWRKLGVALAFCCFFGTSPGAIVQAFAQLTAPRIVPAHSVASRN